MPLTRIVTSSTGYVIDSVGVSADFICSGRDQEHLSARTGEGRMTPELKRRRTKDGEGGSEDESEAAQVRRPSPAPKTMLRLLERDAEKARVHKWQKDIVNFLLPST